MTASSFAHSPLVAAIEDMRASRGWILALGILLMVVGVVCIAGDVTATFATVLVFGWLLLFSAGIALAHAFTPAGGAGSSSGCSVRCSGGSQDICSFDIHLPERWASLWFWPPSLLWAGVSRHRLRDDEVPALGLVGFFGLGVAGAGDHAAWADAGFKHLVHRIRHWRRYALGWCVACRSCHCD